MKGRAFPDSRLRSLASLSRACDRLEFNSITGVAIAVAY